MKILRIVALSGMSLVTMSNSCSQDEAAVPAIPLTTGRIVRTESVFDVYGQNPRPRWIIDVSPLSLEGKWPGHAYSQVKAFNLPDTLTYRTSVTIAFRYAVVPLAQQTPWKTGIEWGNFQPGLLGGEPLAELTLADLQLMPLR